MQAIETEYRGPTETRGSRIIVRAEVGRMSVPWDYALNVEANHDAAARAFIAKWGWHGTWIRGGSANGKGCVYVCARRECQAGYRTPHPQACDPWDTLIVREVMP